MVKIAMMLPGYLRSYQYHFNGLKEIIEKYNIDLYCTTWNVQENNSIVGSDCFNIYQKYLKAWCIVDKFLYEKNIQRIEFVDRDNDIFKTDTRAKEHGKYWIERLRCQWFLIMKCFELIKEDYDIVIKYRYDIKFDDSFTLLNVDNNIVVPKSEDHCFKDHISYGNMSLMRTYSQLFNHIHILYNKYNIDISYAEKMLKFYLEDYSGIKIYCQPNMLYRILK
jgi:hypothetical protein